MALSPTKRATHWTHHSKAASAFALYSTSPTLFLIIARWLWVARKMAVASEISNSNWTQAVQSSVTSGRANRFCWRQFWAICLLCVVIWRLAVVWVTQHKSRGYSKPPFDKTLSSLSHSMHGDTQKLFECVRLRVICSNGPRATGLMLANEVFASAVVRELVSIWHEPSIGKRIYIYWTIRCRLSMPRWENLLPKNVSRNSCVGSWWFLSHINCNTSNSSVKLLLWRTEKSLHTAISMKRMRVGSIWDKRMMNTMNRWEARIIIYQIFHCVSLTTHFPLVQILQEDDETDDCRATPETVRRESESTGAVKMSVYAGYFKSMGSISIVIAAICMLAVEQFAVGLLDYYVSHW